VFGLSGVVGHRELEKFKELLYGEAGLAEDVAKGAGR
jgi:hypothetical protein